MSKLSIGLVTSPSEESDQLIKLLEELGIEITYHISPDEIGSEHIQAENLNVWLLNVNDDDWHDNIDQLLDESEASIYFNEPGNLSKQSHPQYWCKNLVSRLYELTGIDQSSPEPNTPPTEPLGSIPASNLNENDQSLIQDDESQVDSLTSALDELETNSVGIPSEIAADLVSELEAISPELEASIEESSAIDDGLKNVYSETISPDTEIVEVSDVVEPEVVELGRSIDDNSLVEEDLAQMQPVHLAVDDVEHELENSELILEDDEILVDELELESDQQAQLDSTEELDISLESSPDEQFDFLEDFDSGSLDDSDLDFDELELDETTENPETHIVENNTQPELIELDEFESEELEPEVIESETADISDEIMQLADNDISDITSESNIETAYDEIDLSAEVNPVLESVRENDSKPSESVFDAEAQEAVSDEQGSELQNSEQAIEFLSDLDSVTNASADSEVIKEAELELNFELENETESIAAFETKTETETETELKLEQGLDSELELVPEQELDLVLSDADSQLDAEIEPDPESTTPQSELATGGLELESIEQTAQEKITGKAVFIEEQQEQQVQKVQPESSDSEPSSELELSDGGLSLESIGDDPLPTTGKAKFVIDDEIKDSDNQLESLVSNNRTDVIVEETREEAKEVDDSVQLDAQLDQELSLVNQDLEDTSDEHLDLTMTDDATELSDGLMGLDHELLDQSEPESFEIPMLDDAATGLDFEEPIQPIIQKTELCPCWVIGASLGGPAAVKRFLQSLPKDINASFIITQHIDENFLPVLAEILTTSSQFEVKVANGSNPMTAGQIYLAPLNGKTIFLQDGSMLVDRSQKWSEPYSPCIDDVIESLSSVYKEKSGAIIFSGMGQDGLNGAKKMKALGGQIWAQSVDTCANSSMPDAVINEQLTNVVASPEMLAEQLALHLAS